MNKNLAATPLRVHSAGFTLFELMITITVLAILLGIGVPSFTDTIRANRVATGWNELVLALSLARSEANKRGSPVSVCAANNSQTACAGAATSDWSNGWLVFSDNEGAPGTLDIDGAPDDEVLQVASALTGGVQLTTDNQGFVRYANSGAPLTGNGIEFYIRHPNLTDAARARCLSINAVGRVHLKKGTCS